jgi:SHS2 domain-containing protein
MLNNPESLRPLERLPLDVDADSVELALLRTLEEMIFHKDARSLLLRASGINIEHTESTGQHHWRVRGTMIGEAIDRHRHDLANDVKAVTLHQLSVRRTNAGWEARVVLDV